MKKIFALILALTCVLGLGGCGRSMNDVINTEDNPARADTVYAICLITPAEREENNKS